MLSKKHIDGVYLALGATDLRKSIDGLAILVQESFNTDPFSRSLFVFCNRKKDKIKILEWDNNGFWLYYIKDVSNSFLTEEGLKRFIGADEDPDSHNMEVYSGIFSYFTEDALGISININHALGDHLEFELEYQDIANNIKAENEVWKDFTSIIQSTKTGTKGIKERQKVLTEEKMLEELLLDNGDNIQLVYDRNVVIRLKNQRIVLRSDITETMLFNKKEMPNVEFELHKVIGSNYIGVTEYNPGMKAINVIETIFKINNGQLTKFWSSNNKIVLKLLNINKNKVEVGCFLSPKPIILNLTEDEGKQVVDRLDEIKVDLEAMGMKMDKDSYQF